MFREFCETVHDRRGFLLPETDIRGRQGFISVFGFSEQDAAVIKANGHSRGFREFAVGSNKLILDLDDGEASVSKVCDYLGTRQIAHWVYTSGSKGFHVYADCEPGYSTQLPYQHKQLALQIAPSCDVTLYRPNSLVRLPGTIHDKTGRPKTLVAKIEGREQLKLPEVVVPVQPEIKVTDKDALYFVFAQLAASLDGETTQGGRHDALWRLVADCRRAGLQHSTCLDIAMAVNAQFIPPKADADVTRVVDAGYLK